jgi:hypothetical protein
MIRFTTLRKTALSLPEVSEEPHFEKISFRVNKKIFASYDAPHHRACIKLTEIDQDVFSAYDKRIIFPVPTKWGKQGWTFVDMNQVSKEVFVDALKTAYCEVAPKKLSALVRKNP